MSTKITVQFEVRNAAIMKDTLTQLGHTFTEQNEGRLIMKRAYNDIVIDANAGQVTYDSSHKRDVDQIKQTYMVNWYKDKAIREGMSVEEEVQSNGEIVLHVNRMS